MGKTIAIVDFAHCGTTMLAGMLEIAGIPMVGNNYEEAKWEDHDIIETLKKPKKEKKFARIVEERNGKYDVWGFKYPGAWKFMPTMMKHLRNPIFLAIYKDPVSVTLRRFGPKRERMMGHMMNTIHQMNSSIEGIYKAGQVVYMFSYQKAILSPREFAQELLDVVGIEADEKTVEKLIAFIQPNRGHPLTPYPSVKKWI